MPAPFQRPVDACSAADADAFAADADAFAAVFRQYYARLCGIVQAHVRSRAISEEIVQELFLRLWRQRETLAITESLRAYLLRAARNAALSHLKRRRLERDWEHQAASEPPKLVPSAEEAMSGEALARAVERAVEDLPERCRLIYTMNRSQGLSYGDIAAALDISPKTVETQMMRALRKLRNKLHDYLP